MVDVRKPVTLRGFPVSVADVGDQMHLCHPLLSFEGDPALYLAHRLDWRNDPEALAIADPNEASALGTLLPLTGGRSIASGEGLVAAGAELVQAAATAGVELLDSEIPFARVDGTECWIGVATPALYTALRNRLAEEARAAFDEALGDAAHRGSRLSERGDAALLLMRKCGSLRRDDLAIRQLAGAWQNREFDLHRRLLIRFALELETQEDILDDRVKRYVAAVRQTVISAFTDNCLFDGEMYSETIDRGLVSAPSGFRLTGGPVYSYMPDRDMKNYFGGIKERMLKYDPKADFFMMNLEEMTERYMQLLPYCAFEVQENQKTNLGSSTEESSRKEIINPLVPDTAIPAKPEYAH